MVLDGQAGCVALNTYYAQIAQEDITATLSYKFGLEFQHEIPMTEFRQLWETIQVCDPLTLNDAYKSQGLSLGDFSGTLSIEWQSAGQTFHKIIKLDGARFFEDARMQKLYDTLNALIDAHCRMENEARNGKRENVKT